MTNNLTNNQIGNPEMPSNIITVDLKSNENMDDHVRENNTGDYQNEMYSQKYL